MTIPDSNTDEWWSITDTSGNEVSLHQFGWSITTIGGSRASLPNLRGEDIAIAYRPGKEWRMKYADSRTITLLMYVQGSDPATGNNVDDVRLRYNDSWHFLRKLFWRPYGRQITLTRRVWETDPVTHQPHILVSSAQVQIAGTMEPTVTGRYRSTFSVDLLMADPFFYGDPVSVTLPMNTWVTINNPGDDVAAYNGVGIVFNGPLTNPRVTNVTPTPDVYVQASQVPIGAGAQLRLKIDDFTLLGTAGAPTTFPLSLIQHSGARSWMGLLPGNNSVILQGSGTGNAVLTFAAPYV